ncbi:MAG TPA: HD domain-containing protein [Streptosporangiaceae bacterium]|nr:HD domain-containing protein [Streptosporangiaceae bacterium]
MTDADPVGQIADLFASEGRTEYLGEAVTQAAHMLQAAHLAEQEGADGALVAAALLHDVGHFKGAVSGQQLMAGTDNMHSHTGADWLAQWFGPEVTEPVRLHVAAKRYLCAVEPGYAKTLSAASVYTLSVQGGPMSGTELDDFAVSPYSQDACRLRRWDDAAKDPDAATPPFEHFRPLLSGLVRN